VIYWGYGRNALMAYFRARIYLRRALWGGYGSTIMPPIDNWNLVFDLRLLHEMFLMKEPSSDCTRVMGFVVLKIGDAAGEPNIWRRVYLLMTGEHFKESDHAQKES
jgi:hypothetical protein